jgi:hypothetical protein
VDEVRVHTPEGSKLVPIESFGPADSSATSRALSKAGTRVLEIERTLGIELDARQRTIIAGGIIASQLETAGAMVEARTSPVRRKILAGLASALKHTEAVITVDGEGRRG